MEYYRIKVNGIELQTEIELSSSENVVEALSLAISLAEEQSRCRVRSVYLCTETNTIHLFLEREVSNAPQISTSING